MILGISALVIAIIALALTLWRMIMKPKPKSEPVVVYQQPMWYDPRPLWFRHPANRRHRHRRHRRHHRD